MPVLPSGTVTFLFTDVEGSTKLLEDLGAETYAQLLQEHRAIVREACMRHGGVEVDTQGDAFFVAFSRAQDGLAAAADAQGALAGGSVRIRVGVHTGEPLLTNEGYVGGDVHRAARIMSAGHGGQVLISQTTRDLLDGRFELRLLGEHRLKDLTAPQCLYQLGHADFPPLRTLDATNLPIAASPLLGRETELDELVALLSNGSRLVTVTGPGGTGKTRLALQAASELVGRPRDGVFWVPLAPLADPGLVMPAIGEALGAGDNVVTFLRDREALVLLDNAEHVLAAAEDLGRLLTASPRLRLLVTSRSPMHMSGEREYPLEPLRPAGAAALFCERAKSVGRDVVPDAAVAEICRRLDGLPLAVELAAARTKLLDPATLLSRLDERLPILTGGARDAPERQRTLHATIEWSHDLLDEDAKVLFRRLAVFAGGFSLDAAELVCDADLDSLAGLVDMSLVKATGDARFLMLETIREYAGKRLTESGEADATAARHAGYFGRLADELDEARGRFGDAGPALAQLEIEQSNLRAGLAWASRVGDGALQLRLLLGAAGMFLRGSQSEFRRLLEDALGLGTEDVRLRGRAEAGLAFVAYRQGDYSASRAAATRALTLAEQAGDSRIRASALNYLSSCELADGDVEEARALLEQATEAYRVDGNNRGIGVTLINLGDVAIRAGAYSHAVDLTLEAITLLRPLGDPTPIHVALLNLATACVQLDRLDEAEAYGRESLEIVAGVADMVGVSCCVRVFAAVAARRGHGERAARLLGAAERIRTEIDLSLEPSEAVLQADLVGRLEEFLSSDDRSKALSEGKALSAEAAVEYALAAESA
jgi:predicted ATPase/class 3 adenylate cyclase